ncbi:MAG: hypothetical protein K0S07_5 [Chlamydiales bacterium]|jgi:hypothetical protein|nr:hypothetical protein [Chlamydiales bacterium]
MFLMHVKDVVGSYLLSKIPFVEDSELNRRLVKKQRRLGLLKFMQELWELPELSARRSLSRKVALKCRVEYLSFKISSLQREICFDQLSRLTLPLSLIPQTAVAGAMLECAVLIGGTANCYYMKKKKEDCQKKMARLNAINQVALKSLKRQRSLEKLVKQMMKDPLHHLALNQLQSSLEEQAIGQLADKVGVASLFMFKQALGL